MKIYISADMEGLTGVAHWDEVTKEKEDYPAFQKQMTAEVIAACKGAFRAGANEIWIKDAHDTGRNIDPAALPHGTHLIRGWSGHPFSMVQGLDDSFQALIMIGYHSWAGSGGNPLAHTMTGKVAEIHINEQWVSEFLLYGMAAASVGVPVVCVTGDEALCQQVRAVNEHIHTVAVKSGHGEAVQSLTPNETLPLIKETVQKALEGDLSRRLFPLPKQFNLKLKFTKHFYAYKASFYPGVQLLDDQTIGFETDQYFELLRLLAFIL